MKRLYLLLRCGLLWTISILHFFPGGLLLLFLSFFWDPRKHDRLQRFFARNVLRLAGARLQVRRAAGFDPNRTSIFVSNHVNLFDPFVIYSSVPQFVRGWELESHFRIFVYGWIMKRFGNIPVPEKGDSESYQKLFERTKHALDNGISLVVFAEGGRTLNGRVRRFRKGIFRMAKDLGYPIAPLSMVGSYEFNRKDSRMLYPSTIVVHLHDTIETKNLSEEELERLPETVQAIVSRPVEEHLGTAREHVPARA